MLGTHYLLTAMQLPGIKFDDVYNLQRNISYIPGNLNELLFEISHHHSQLTKFNKYTKTTWMQAEDATKALESQCYNCHISIITNEDNNYPTHLKHIAKPPFIIFARGNKTLLDRTAIVVTGTKKPTVYGQKCAKRIGQVICDLGLIVVGGLKCKTAKLAHEGCLKSLGNTIAISDRALPTPEKADYLAEQIIDMNGLVISENAPNTLNINSIEAMRLSVGLSRAVIVIEYNQQDLLRHLINFARYSHKAVATLGEANHFKIDNDCLPDFIKILKNRLDLENFLNDALHTHYHNSQTIKQLSLHS